MAIERVKPTYITVCDHPRCRFFQRSDERYEAGYAEDCHRLSTGHQRVRTERER